MTLDRRTFLKAGAGLLTVLSGLDGFIPEQAQATAVSEDLSPRNSKRRRRADTKFIILHTTEAPDGSSLAHIKRYGLANYMVSPNGEIHSVIEQDRVARHAGRSMWDDISNLDNHAVGIEVVGEHNRPITPHQESALKELLTDLQRKYHVSDERVMPHSMVAYGAPNRWHPYSHRGRKRCGMLFGTEEERIKLGLTQAPKVDPDVKAGRLRVADQYLYSVLFASAPGPTARVVSQLNPTPILVGEGVTPWGIAREEYDAPTTMYKFPDGTIKRGNEITDWDAIPKRTIVQTDVAVPNTPREDILEDVEHFRTITGNDTAWSVAGREYNHATTIYFLPDKRIRTGQQMDQQFITHLPRGTQVLTGYVYGGKVKRERTAYSIAGQRWDDAATFYHLPDHRIVSGDDISSAGVIPIGTSVFFRNGAD